MALTIEVRTANGKYYIIEEEGGDIHVYKPGWLGREGLGISFRSIEDAKEAIEEDAESEIEEARET